MWFMQDMALPLTQIRRADLTLRPVDGQEYLRLVQTQAESEIGSVKSQYIDELARGDKSVGAVGLWACGEVVGAASYGIINLPRDLSLISGRIDVVVTQMHCRKRGIGTLMMAALVDKFLKDFGKRVTHFSTIAVHPSVGHSAAKMGFEEVAGDVPLFRIRINDDNRALLQKRVDGLINKTMSSLRAECVKCQAYRWHKPWCRKDSP
jgi:hypothetical protein